MTLFWPYYGIGALPSGSNSHRARRARLLTRTPPSVEGVAQAAHHATHRRAFGAALVDQPLMRNVLADLAVEAEAATTVALWLAELTGRAAGGDERESHCTRILQAQRCAGTTGWGG